MRPISLLSTFVVAILSALAYPGSVGAEVPPVIHVSVKEYAVQTDISTVTVGQWSFVATNNGTIPHRFLVIRTDLAPDRLPVLGTQVDTAHVQVVAQLEPFGPGTTENLPSELTAGSYVLICNMPGHYIEGMRTALTVTAAPETPQPTQTPISIPPSVDGVALPHSGSGPSRHTDLAFGLLATGAAAIVAIAFLFAAQKLRNR